MLRVIGFFLAGALGGVIVLLGTYVYERWRG